MDANNKPSPSSYGTSGSGTLLQIVLDLNPYSWAFLKSAKKMVFNEFMKNLLAFINSYLSLKTGNNLFIIAGGLDERLINPFAIDF